MEIGLHYKALKAVREELTGSGGAFEVAEVEVRGQRIRDYVHTPANIRDFWLSTEQFADRPYLVYRDERTSYGEAHARVRAIAGWLFDAGVGPGDRVAIAMRNYPEWMLIYWACVASGIAVVGMNAWWTSEEMAYAVADSQPSVIFLDSERYERLRQSPKAMRGMKIVAVRFGAIVEGVIDWSAVISHGGGLPDVEIDADADACIFYTSGTTGHPKGAQLTHRSCVANLFNMLYAVTSMAMAAERTTGVAPLEAPPPVSLVSTPLFHVTANNCVVYTTTAAGGALVFMYRWDAGEALALIASERVTGLSAVPAMVRELVIHPDFSATDTSSLASLAGGGAQLPPDLVHKVEAQLASARPGTGYGMTETSGIITSVAGDLFIDKPDSVGPAMPNFEMKCVDDADNIVPAGELGELWVRGSSVIKGYLNRPDATADAITDGWLHTGDVARIDEEGFVYIVDRKKDMVIRGGENIYCAEVEAAIYRHPDIAECCVFGVPDERLGETVAAAIVLKSGARASVEALREHCADILSRYKVPERIWLMDQALPRNASGKFLKRELRDRLAAAGSE